MAVPGVPRPVVHGGGQHRSDHWPRARGADRFRRVRGRRRRRHARRSGRQPVENVVAVVRGTVLAAAEFARSVRPTAPGRPETQVPQILPVTAELRIFGILDLGRISFA